MAATSSTGEVAVWARTFALSNVPTMVTLLTHQARRRAEGAPAGQGAVSRVISVFARTH